MRVAFVIAAMTGIALAAVYFRREELVARHQTEAQVGRLTEQRLILGSQDSRLGDLKAVKRVRIRAEMQHVYMLPPEAEPLDPSRRAVARSR